MFLAPYATATAALDYISGLTFDSIHSPKQVVMRHTIGFEITRFCILQEKL